jgi:hypothetical protein
MICSDTFGKSGSAGSANAANASIAKEYFILLGKVVVLTLLFQKA